MGVRYIQFRYVLGADFFTVSSFYVMIGVDIRRLAAKETMLLWFWGSAHLYR